MKDDSQLIWEAYFDRDVNIELINAVEGLSQEERLYLIKIWADDPTLQRRCHEDSDFLYHWLLRRQRLSKSQR